MPRVSGGRVSRGLAQLAIHVDLCSTFCTIQYQDGHYGSAGMVPAHFVRCVGSKVGQKKCIIKQSNSLPAVAGRSCLAPITAGVKFAKAYCVLHRADLSLFSSVKFQDGTVVN